MLIVVRRTFQICQFFKSCSSRGPSSSTDSFLCRSTFLVRIQSALMLWFIIWLIASNEGNRIRHQWLSLFIRLYESNSLGLFYLTNKLLFVSWRSFVSHTQNQADQRNLSSFHLLRVTFIFSLVRTEHMMSFMLCKLAYWTPKWWYNNHAIVKIWCYTPVNAEAYVGMRW